MTAQELRDFEEMFATNAWKRMMSDAEEALRERELGALAAQTWEQVCFFKGEAAQLHILLSLETAIRLAAANSFDDEGDE
jgi:hypothetical protein